MAKKTVIKATPEEITHPQNFWDDSQFNQALAAHGYKANIERAMKCPCGIKDIGASLSNCGNCGGSSWVFIDSTETVVQCVSMNNKSKFENWTEENMGTASISTRPSDKLGYMDKVTLIELHAWHNETEATKVASDNKRFAFLTYEPVNVFDVYAFDEPSNPLIRLGEGDYTIIDNKIVIGDDFQPSVNDLTITIRYTFHPVYHILDINRDMIKQVDLKSCEEVNGAVPKVNFPLNYVARRAHYMLEKPNYSGDRYFDNTDYDTVPKKYDL